MSNEITFTTIRNQLHDLDTQFKGSYTTPEALLALVKTIKSFNITITDWNTLINFINTTGSSVEGVYNFIPSIIDLVESEVNKLDNVKLEIASKVKRVDALPEVGEPDTYYVVQDEDSATLHRVYFYNKWREEYVYLGSNAIDLGEYYTKTEGQQFEADLNAAFDNFYENAQEIIREKAEIYFASKEDKANKVTTLSNASTDTQYPSAKLLYDTIQYVIAVAEGKCKSYILSNSYLLSEASWSNYTVYDENGDIVPTWADFQTLIGVRSLLNDQLKTQTAFTDSISLYYILTGESTRFYYHRAENYFANAKTGDIVLVKQLNVPDRWLEVNTNAITFYILETSKVDISNMVTTDTPQEITGTKTIYATDLKFKNEYNSDYYTLRKNNEWLYVTLNGNQVLEAWSSTMHYTYKNLRPGLSTIDLGSDGAAWKNLYLSGNIYLGGANTSQIQFGDQYTYIKTNNDNDLVIRSKGGTIWCERNVKPNENNLDLGGSSAKWRDAWINTLKGLTTLTQAQYDALVSGGTVDADTLYLIVEE